MKSNDNDNLLQYMMTTKRYQILFKSLVVLSLFVLSFVIINFYIARYSTQSTEHMDIIGNISDLTLEIATGAQHLAVIHSTVESKEIIHTLQKQADQLDSYMAKLSNYKKQESAMDEFAVIWKDYRNRIAQLSDQDEQGKIALADFAYHNQAKIWDLMNIGYDTYLNDTYRTADYSRYLTYGSFIALIGYILFFINYTVRQMYIDDVVIDKAQNDMRDIMNTVKEGLFLIDDNMVIGANYSKKLEKLLGRHQLAGLTLPQLLENIVSEQEIAATQYFINYLYESSIDEDFVQDINPLKKVEIIFLDEKGFTNHKYLSFDFLRVVKTDHKKSIKLFVSVVDITKSVQLKQQLEKVKTDYYNFINHAVYLLSLDKQIVNEFIAKNRATVAKINETLDIRVWDKAQLVAKVKTLLIQTEMLVDTSQTLGLTQYDDIVSCLLYDLKCLTRLCDIQPNDFSNFIDKLAQYQDILKLTEQLINKQTLKEYV